MNVMKKLICSLGMISFLTIGVVPMTHAQEEVKVKHGMSRRGKGALIGGAGGAVVGGLIGHGVGGALIGGAAGAGAGYLIGRHKDKEHGYSRPVIVKKKYHD
jgi:uncharacterized protein YcfJ